MNCRKLMMFQAIVSVPIVGRNAFSDFGTRRITESGVMYTNWLRVA